VIREIGERLIECRLELHPAKTKIVYCRDGYRKGKYHDVQFNFLGYSFRPRHAMSRRGNLFLSFLPTVNVKAAKSIRVQRSINGTTNKPIQLFKINMLITGFLKNVPIILCLLAKYYWNIYINAKYFWNFLQGRSGSVPYLFRQAIPKCATPSLVSQSVPLIAIGLMHLAQN
jgi:hypothetical protein